MEGVGAKCILKSVSENYNDITMWSNDPVILGRSRDTKINDKRCSKRQVEVCVTTEGSERLCRVEQFGGNQSTLNGEPLQPKEPRTARHGDVIEVLTGLYKYTIEFPSPSKTSVQVEEKPSVEHTAVSTNGSGQKESTSTTNTNDDTLDKMPRKSKTVSETKAKAGGGKSKEENPAPATKSPVTKPPVTKLPIKKPLVTAKVSEQTEMVNSVVSKKRPAPEKAEGSVKKTKMELGAKGGTKEGESTWTSVENGDLLIYGQHSIEGREKIAAYDMDGTLITTQSGKVFPTDYNDWRILFSEVPGKLKQMQSDGYKIVLITNQAGIGTGKNTVSGVQGKITRILAKLGVAAQVLVSTGKGKFRKPAPFTWRYLEQHCNGGVEVQRDASVFVGDAAGRPEVKKVAKKDHSLADRLFALNIGVPFFTPQEHFLGRKTEAFKMPDFDPRSFPTTQPQYEPNTTKVPKHKTELIVLVGFPASGKSFFVSTVLAKLGYLHANRDTLGTWQKCAAFVQKSLKAGQSVVVDNTNPDKESRGRYVQLAAALKVPARCFVFNVSKDHARHNNKFREFTDESHSKVTDMIFNMYKSKYKEPEKSEGFEEIVRVNFLPTFSNDEDEQLYRLFLLEK